MKKLFLTMTSFVIAMGLFGCAGDSKEEKNEEKNSATVLKSESESFQQDEQSASFDYTPIKPAEDGILKGVVELGASGFNLFIIKIDKQKNWEIKKKEFGTSLIKEGMTNIKEVKETLKNYIQSIINFGVEGKRIFFVVSSGAQKEALTLKIAKALEELGYFVNVVTPEQEAKYAFNATMPKELQTKAFVVDMGSGNTKISYIKDDKIKAIETYGSKYFQEDIDDLTVAKSIKETLAEIPLSCTKTCFLIGGIPHQMAKIQRNKEERYTILKKDLTFYEQLINKKGHQAACGLNIYESILRTKQIERVVFDWDTNFSIGFLLSLKY